MPLSPDRPMTDRARFSIRGAFILVFVTALAIRLLFLFVALPLAPRIVPGFQSVPGMSFDGYHQIALELVAGRGFALPDDAGPTAGGLRSIRSFSRASIASSDPGATSCWSRTRCSERSPARS